MNNYVTMRIMKKYLVLLGVVIVLACGIGAYYVWCSNHPDIQIQVSYGGTGKEGIQVEAPHIMIAANGIAEPAAAVELKTNNIVMQHEFQLAYIKENYQAADIKLDMESKDDYLTLKYYGTATTLDGEKVDYKKDINLDYTIDATIIKK